MTYQSGRWFAYFNLFILHCTLIYLQSISKRKRRTHSEIKVIKTDHPHNNNTNLLLCMNTGYLSYFRYMLELKIKGFITCCFFHCVMSKWKVILLSTNMQEYISLIIILIKYERGQCTKASRTRYDLCDCFSTVNYNY